MNSGIMQVVFLDVGQGDSILIITPNRNQLLVDTSENEIVIRKISKHLHFFDKTIDLLITTHPDADHIGGVPALLKKYVFAQYGYFFDSPGSPLNDQIDKLIEKKRIQKTNLKAGDEIILDQEFGIKAKVFWPDPDAEIEDKNDQSIVMKISYDQIDFMLTGDAGILIEEKIITALYKNVPNVGDQDANLESEILKLGHHGSKTSTSAEFLERVSPNFVVISAGEDNKFGHPHQEVIDRINSYSERFKPITILETKKKPVIFKTDGQILWVD